MHHDRDKARRRLILRKAGPEILRRQMWGTFVGRNDHVVSAGGFADQHGIEKRGSGHPINET